MTMKREPLSNLGIVHEHCMPPAPGQKALDAIGPGTAVKIIRGGERFWCIVAARTGNALVGVVSNDLVCTDVHGLNDGDSIEFPVTDVIEVSL